MRFLLAPAVFLILASSLTAQYAPAVDVKTMLQGLRDLKQTQTKAAQTSLVQSINDFSAAGASDDAALDFYVEAVRVTQFVGQEKEQSAFRDWKKREMNRLKPPAIRACLRYMVLSLQRSAGATDQQIFPGLLSYAEDTQSMLPAIGDEEIVKQPVSSNIFARWYNLGEQLGGLENWEPSPGNVDSIYKQLLLPIMRKNRDPRILQYWDRKIAAETAAASTAAAAFSTDHFNQIRRPELLWSRAEDMVAIDERDQGLAEMYNLIKSFPTHPSAGKWIDELQGLLTGATTSGTGAAAPAPAQ